MTTEDMVERWTDELLGVLAQAAVAPPTGAGFSLWLKVTMAKVRGGVKELVEAANANVIDEFVRVYPTLPPTEREKIAGRLKQAVQK